MEAGAVPGDGAAAPPAGEPPAHPPRKLHTPMDYVRRLNGRVRPPWSLGADAGDSARAQRQRSGKRGSWLRPFTDAQHAADSTEPHSAGIPPSASAPEVAAAPSQIPNGRPLPTFERSAQLGAQHAGGPLAYTTSAPDGGARPWGSQPASGFQPSSPDASASPFDRRIAGAQAGADARQDGDAGRATPLPVAAPALHVSDIPPWAYAPPAPPARNAWGALAQTPVDAGTRVATEPASVYGVATTTSPPVASAPLAMPAAYTQADGLCAPGQRGAIRRQTQPESPLVGKAEAPGSGPSRVFPAPVPEPTLPSEPLTPRPTRTSEAPGPGPTQTSQAGPEPAWPSQPAAPEPTRTAQTPAPEPTRASHAPAPGPAAMRQPAAPVPEPQPPAPVPGATPQLPAAVAAPEPLAPHPPGLGASSAALDAAQVGLGHDEHAAAQLAAHEHRRLPLAHAGQRHEHAAGATEGATADGVATLGRPSAHARGRPLRGRAFACSPPCVRRATAACLHGHWRPAHGIGWTPSSVRGGHGRRCAGTAPGLVLPRGTGRPALRGARVQKGACCVPAAGGRIPCAPGPGIQLPPALRGRDAREPAGGSAAHHRGGR